MLTMFCITQAQTMFVPGGQSVCGSSFGYGSYGYNNNVNVGVYGRGGGISVSVPVVRRQHCHWENRSYTTPVTVYTMAAPGVYLLYNGQYVTHIEQQAYTIKEWVCD